MSFEKLKELVKSELLESMTSAEGNVKYQQLFGLDTPSDRKPSNERWNIIRDTLPEAIESLADIGCNNGYFVFKTCELRNIIGFGIEGNKDNVQLMRLIQFLNPHIRASFLNLNVTNDTAYLVPQVDVMVNFSVFQHFVRQGGLEYAIRIMETLVSKVNKLMYFETGTSQEDTLDYRETLAFMNPDPDVWIQRLLKDLGFKSIQVFELKPRAIFVASK